jgi:hypothetical protein
MTNPTTITYEELRARFPEPKPPSGAELDALRRLLAIAQHDTGQSRRVAGFLLAWWNAQSCGGFDLTDLWAVDEEIAQDMLVVLGLIARVHQYPPALGFEAEFKQIVRAWRSEPAEGA